MDFAFLSDGTRCILGWGGTKRFASATKNSFYINDFQLKAPQPWVQFENTKWVDTHDFQSLEVFLDQLPFTSQWQLEDEGSFLERYQKAEHEFRRQQLRKVLLHVCDRGKKTQSLRKVSLDAHFFYAFSFASAGAWGTSPELLFDLYPLRAEIQTMALAGTFEKKIEARHLPEHAEVRSFFEELASRNQLRLDIKEQGSASFGQLNHIKSEVLLSNIGTKNVDDWIREFHPTPALGVSPRNPASLDFLMTLREGLPPHFAAPMGFYTEEHCRMIGMIRGTFFKGDDLWRPIGVGVTPYSDSASEWNEINLKRKATEEVWKALI